jgi:hypothetical protein
MEIGIKKVIFGFGVRVLWVYDGQGLHNSSVANFGHAT